MTGSGTRYQGRTTGAVFTLGNMIARGGEGAVFDLNGDIARVAKIYTQPPDNIKAEKLDMLIRLDRPQLRNVSAWPQEVLVDSARKPVGFVMPAILGGKPLHLFTSPVDRQTHAPGSSFATLVGIAANLARAVTTFHQAGVVLADINFSNFLVLPNGTVRIIDCDSVQIGRKAKFRSAVAMAEFVPPELQGTRVADHDRTDDHDTFSLSVLIFLLLVQGRHPFSGNGAMSIGDAIKKRRHPFRLRCSKTGPFRVLGFDPSDILSPLLIEHFRASFNGGHWYSRYRPSALHWMTALDAFARSLVRCRDNRAHAYSQSASRCPWCRLETQGKPALFAPTPPKSTPARRGIVARLLRA